MCKTHDIAYDNSKESSERYKADKALTTGAFKRIFAKNATWGERAVATAVASAIGAKMKLTNL